MATRKTITTVTETVITDDQRPVITPELLVKDGQVFCTSLQVAQDFSKEHKHVIRDIEEQIEKIQAGRHAGKEASMFQADTYAITNNLGYKVRKPMYMLNRSGFVKLINGYTGQRASDTQMDYIEAFDAMEAALMGQGKPQPIPQKISAAQRREIETRISGIATHAHMTGSASYDISNALKYHLNTDSIGNIHPNDYQKALDLLTQMAKQTSDIYLPLRIELDSQWFKALRGNTPDVRELKKEWQKRFNALLPKTYDWAEITSLLH
jgi:Rha family phage regulatory protein